MISCSTEITKILIFNNKNHQNSVASVSPIPPTRNTTPSMSSDGPRGDVWTVNLRGLNLANPTDAARDLVPRRVLADEHHWTPSCRQSSPKFHQYNICQCSWQVRAKPGQTNPRSPDAAFLASSPKPEKSSDLARTKSSRQCPSINTYKWNVNGFCNISKKIMRLNAVFLDVYIEIIEW